MNASYGPEARQREGEGERGGGGGAGWRITGVKPTEDLLAAAPLSQRVPKVTVGVSTASGTEGSLKKSRFAQHCSAADRFGQLKGLL